ncbi:Probable periplasmic serine endoprotease DegP-like [Chlamydiales bacterium SCGC AG-110-P3]|nr:Probable periplasmic serine endoprotease DegP-like [Chlamydiales bacterium SCGC AG-110-P3]
MTIRLKLLFLGIAAVIAVLVMTPEPVAAATSQTANIGFEHVAKTAIPAVVSIRVTGPDRTAPQNPMGQGLQSNDEFWQRFFGMRPQGTPSPTQPVIGQGSGIIVSPDGYVVTNNHVVRDAKEIKVVLTDGREFMATLVGQDQNTDIAIIKIKSTNLPYLTLGNSQNLAVGQWVVAIGNPLGLQASLTAGVVSATGRNDLHINTVEDFIQTDAAINRGNSGGPLLNLAGEVVGINTAIASNTGGYMGIGFAIPSNMVANIMDQLIAHGCVTRGFMGVTLQAIDRELADAFRLEKVEGVLVAEVVTGSPAETAGIQQGDVILSHNGKAVSNLSSIRNAVSLMTPGTEVKLTVKREGSISEVALTVGTHPDNICTSSGRPSRTGFEVQPMTPALAHRLGYVNDEGVLISGVHLGGPAEAAGLSEGQLIVAVNQKKISTPGEFYRELDRTENDRLLLLVKQGRYSRFVSLRLR